MGRRGTVRGKVHKHWDILSMMSQYLILKSNI